MNYAIQFRGFVKSTVRKNKAALPDFTEHEIEAECWAVLAIAIHRWDGSKGKLSSWIYTAVTGRMKDLRKRLAIKLFLSQEYLDFSVMDSDITTTAQTNN